jgi:hypothetical protein
LLIQKPQNEAEAAGRSYYDAKADNDVCDPCWMDKGRQPAWDGLLRAIRCVAALTNGITINAKLAQARFAPRLAAHPSKTRLGHAGFNQRFLKEEHHAP